MKLVFICQDPFPYSGACGGLIYKLIKAGVNSHHWEICVVCAQAQVQAQYEEKIGVTICRYWNWDSLTLKDAVKLFASEPIKGAGGLIYKLSNRLNRKSRSDFVVKKGIVKQIQKCLASLECGKQDVLIPVAGLYETVQAALEWKKKNGGHVVVYQVDPCSTNLAYSENSRAERCDFEKNIYRLADRVVTTPIIFNELKDVIPPKDMLKTTTMEFPNLVLSQVCTGIINEKSHGEIINCVFSGMVYRKIRDPEFTIKLFGSLNKKSIVFTLVGVARTQAEQYISNSEIRDNIVFHGYMPSEEAMKYTDDADVLVNIGNSALNQVPSKLFSYIATGKPIVNVCVSRNCPTLQYMNRYPLSLNLFQTDDLYTQTEMLESFIRTTVGKRVSKKTIEDAFYECSAEYCSGVFTKICKELIGENV